MKTPQKKPKFPHEVRSGSVSVRIFKEFKKIDGTSYTTYRLYWIQEGRKMREGLNDWKKAVTRAQTIADDIAGGRAYLTKIDPAEWDIYLSLKKRIAHTGQSLSVAIDRFLEAWTPDLVEETVHNVYEKFYQATSDRVQKGNASPLYLRDIKLRVGKFEKAFSKRIISSLKQIEVRTFIEKWDDLKTQNNFLGNIKAFFAFAKKQGHLKPLTDHILNSYELNTVKGGTKGRKKEKLTDTKDLRLLFHAILRLPNSQKRDQLLITLGIFSFSGIRIAEFRRLTWEDLDWDQNGILDRIHLDTHITKTNFKRTVFANQSLKDIFAVVERKDGDIRLTEFDCPDRAIHKVAKRVGIKWKQNGLRHGYITYEWGRLGNIEQVATLAGTSAQVIRSNYNELRKEDGDIEKWFSAASLPLKLFKAFKESGEENERNDDGSFTVEYTDEDQKIDRSLEELARQSKSNDPMEKLMDTHHEKRRRDDFAKLLKQEVQSEGFNTIESALKFLGVPVGQKRAGESWFDFLQNLWGAKTN